MFKIMSITIAAISVIAAVSLSAYALYYQLTHPSCEYDVFTPALMMSGFLLYVGCFVWCLRD